MENEWTIDYFTERDGRSPVEEFILSLPVKDQNKVIRAIEMLEAFGINLREPHTDYLEDGIYELRTKQGSNIQRILYFHYVDKTFILLHGFTKKTQKTPAKEKRIAKERRQQYLKRQEVPV